MNNKSLLMVLLVAVPVLVIVYLLGFNPGTNTPNNNDTPSVNNNNTPNPNPSPGQSAKRPVPETNPYVQNIIDTNDNMVRYDFTGTIAQVKTVDQNKQLVLTGNLANLPDMVITPETRIQAIKYNPVVLTPKTVNDLKAGLTVDVSFDYEVSSQRWFFRDIYIPADRNP